MPEATPVTIAILPAKRSMRPPTYHRRDSDFAVLKYQNTVGLVSLNDNKIPLAVYPNPVTSQSVVEYALLRKEEVSIRLYDLKGELIQSILNETIQEQGEHEVSLQIDGNVAHGNYLLKVETSTSLTSIEIHI